MADCHKVDLALGKIETVDHAIIANSKPELVGADHSVMGKRIQAQTHGVDFALDLLPDCGRKLKEVGVELA
jgi:hypothetical protein